MPEPFEMNKLLQGRKVIRVENGTTPGWMVIFFESDPDPLTGNKTEMFLTIYVGGRKGGPDANHYSTCALHKGNSVLMVRDGRDPEMPMSA
jgi:hypothetical protein